MLEKFFGRFKSFKHFWEEMMFWGMMGGVFLTVILQATHVPLWLHTSIALAYLALSYIVYRLGRRHFSITKN